MLGPRAPRQRNLGIPRHHEFGQRWIPLLNLELGLRLGLGGSARGAGQQQNQRDSKSSAGSAETSLGRADRHGCFLPALLEKTLGRDASRGPLAVWQPRPPKARRMGGAKGFPGKRFRLEFFSFSGTFLGAPLIAQLSRSRA